MSSGKREELARKAPLKRGSGPKRGRGFAASKAQRAKVRAAFCVACGADWVWDVAGGGALDPAHLCARAQGGCDDALCTIPLCRSCHRAFDDGRLDLQPYMVGQWVPELQHALGHYNGDLIALLHRLTGCRWVPESER